MNERDLAGIRDTAEHFRQMIEEQTGSRLDYDVPSLAFFDTFLSEWLDLASVYGDQDPRMLELLVVPIASYVGEVLVRTLGAEWDGTVPSHAQIPILRLPTAQLIDLEESVSGIVHGRARPAFHQLALVLSQSSAGDSDKP